MAFRVDMSGLASLIPAFGLPQKQLALPSPAAAEPQTDGALALAPTLPDTSDPSDQTDPSDLLPVLSATHAVIAAERAGAAQSSQELLSTEQRALVREQLAFCRAVWRLWREVGMPYEHAYNAEAARVAQGDYPALATRGKLSARTVRDVWLVKLLDEQTHRPVWDEQRLAPRYRAGAVKQAITKALPSGWTEIFTALYLTRGVRNVRSVWEMSCARALEAGGMVREDLPTYRQARYFARHKIPQRLQDQYRVPQKEKAAVGGYILRKWRDPGEIWMMDHHRLDIRVRVGIPGTENGWAIQRPWITVVRDAASAFIVSVLVYVDQAPNHELIVECLYRALVAAGGVPPRVLVIDNGKDFLRRGVCTDLVVRAASEADSALAACEAAFGEVEIAEDGAVYSLSIARELGIEVRRMRPYAGRQKPVERDFRNVAHDWAKLWPAWVYCGHNPVTRPSESPKEDQQMQREPLQYPSVQQAQDAIELWLGRLHATPSNGRLLKGQTPAASWAGRPATHRLPMAERSLQLACMIPQKPLVQVSNGPSGADLWYRGWWYWGASDADCLALAAYAAGGPERKVLIKTAFSSPVFDYGKKRLPLSIYAFEPSGAFIAALDAAEEFDALDAGKIPDQAEALRAAFRRINLLKAQAKRQHETLTAGLTERRLGPASAAAFAGLAGVDAPPQLPPASDGSPRAAVSAPVVPGPGRGAARAVQAPCADSAEDTRPKADPALMAAFQASLAKRSDDSPDPSAQSVPSDSPSLDFAAFMRTSQ